MKNQKKTEYQKHYGHYTKRLATPTQVEALILMLQLTGDGKIEKPKRN